MAQRNYQSRRRGGFMNTPHRAAPDAAASNLAGMQQSLDTTIRRVEELLKEKRRFLLQVQSADHRIGQLEALLDKSQRKCKELEEAQRQTIAANLQNEEASSSSQSMMWGDIMDTRDELLEQQLREKDQEILRLSELLQKDGQLQRKNKRLQEENHKLREENLKLQQKGKMEVKAAATINMLEEENKTLQQQRDGLEQQRNRLLTTSKELLEDNKRLALSETIMENRCKRLKVEKEQLDRQKDEEVQRLKDLNDSLTVTVSSIQQEMLDKEAENQQREEDWRSKVSALEKLWEEAEQQKREMEAKVKDQLDRQKDEVQRLKSLNDSLTVTVSNIQQEMLDKEAENQQREKDWRSKVSAVEKLQQEAEQQKREMEEKVKELEQRLRGEETQNQKKKKKSFWRCLFPKRRHDNQLKVEEAAGCSE